MDAAFVIYRFCNRANYLASNNDKSIIACDKHEQNAEMASVVCFNVFIKNATVGTEKNTKTLVNRDLFGVPAEI
jgi:hypothetical protein